MSTGRRLPGIELESEGTIDDGDSAYPQATVLANGDVLCSYSNAGGSRALGGTDWARSTDGGRTWIPEGTLLGPTNDPPTTNFLKLSRSPDGRTVYAYGARMSENPFARFGERMSQAVCCRSEDDGRTWTEPAIVPQPGERHEISHAILALRGGRLLAPSASVETGRLGERVVVAISDDAGRTWPTNAVVLVDPDCEKGYFEHKLTDLGDGRLLATAWTIRMADVVDLPNTYAISRDRGETWTAPMETGIGGQTLSTLALGGDWVLALYNSRAAEPRIIAAVVSLRSDRWMTHAEKVVYDPRRRHHGAVDDAGIDRFSSFAFGFPTATRLMDGTVLATYWARSDQISSVRWARLHVLT